LSSRTLAVCGPPRAVLPVQLVGGVAARAGVVSGWWGVAAPVGAAFLLCPTFSPVLPPLLERAAAYSSLTGQRHSARSRCVGRVPRHWGPVAFGRERPLVSRPSSAALRWSPRSGLRSPPLFLFAMIAVLPFIRKETVMANDIAPVGSPVVPKPVVMAQVPLTSKDCGPASVIGEAESESHMSPSGAKQSRKDAAKEAREAAREAAEESCTGGCDKNQTCKYLQMSIKVVVKPVAGKDGHWFATATSSGTCQCE
jgi:hypothetical protein